MISEANKETFKRNLTTLERIKLDILELKVTSNTRDVKLLETSERLVERLEEGYNFILGNCGSENIEIIKL